MRTTMKVRIFFNLPKGRARNLLINNLFSVITYKL